MSLDIIDTIHRILKSMLLFFSGKPSAPRDLVASEIKSTTVILEWKAPKDDGGSAILNYLVERRDKRWGSWVKVGLTKGNVHTLDVAQLYEATEYFFRVSAENEEGFGPEIEMEQCIKTVKDPGRKCVHVG